MKTGRNLSFIHEQIIWDRLIAAVEEQAQTLIATGFSTSTREAGDLSAGVFNPSGQMLAQAVTGTPGHVNSMAASVRHFLSRFPVETMSPGDIFITNDPWKGTGHLHDFTVVTPAFRSGAVVALFASTCHVVDIGGRGLGPESRQVYEEGLYVPQMRFATKGQVNETLIEIIRSNVREPIQVVGDIYSLVTCNEVGTRRLDAIMTEFGLDSLDRIGSHILARTKQAMLEAIKRIPPGVYSHSMRVDGYDKPIDIVAKMTVTDTGIFVDLSGTSGPSTYGINVPFCYTEAYASFGIKCIVAPKVPNNAASLSVIHVSAPTDCILNAQSPAPVATRHVIGQMLPDVMFGCLAQAAPNLAPAEGASCIWVLIASGGQGRVDDDPAKLIHAKAFDILCFHSGGTGARPGKDGLSATAFPSGVKSVPVEITEALSPLLIRRKEFRVDSGGPGRHRGGAGQIMEIESLDAAPFSISANYDRIDFPARGREGGANGATGRVKLASGFMLKGKGRQTIPHGHRLVLEMPGGGGLGSPRDRAPGAVLQDVLDGLVSVVGARKQYGVAITDDMTVDMEITLSLRSDIPIQI